SVVVNAPVLGVTSFVVDDATGNGDGYLDPGETATITVNNSNTGHSTALNGIGTLTSSSSYISVLTSSVNIGNIDVASNPSASFTVTVDTDAPYGMHAPFDYNATAGSYSTEFSFNSIVTPAIEDWETNSFTKFDWIQGGDASWLTEST